MRKNKDDERSEEDAFAEVFLNEDEDSDEESLPIQELSQNKDVESLDVGGYPAQREEASIKAVPHPEKVTTLEYQFFLKKLAKIEIEINIGMSNCNDIERTIAPVLKRGGYIRDNLEQEMARKGERGLIYDMASIISTMSSAFNTADGHVKNIKFALGRLQESIDDVQDNVNVGTSSK